MLAVGPGDWDFQHRLLNLQIVAGPAHSILDSNASEDLKTKQTKHSSNLKEVKI